MRIIWYWIKTVASCNFKACSEKRNWDFFFVSLFYHRIKSFEFDILSIVRTYGSAVRRISRNTVCSNLTARFKFKSWNIKKLLIRVDFELLSSRSSNKMFYYKLSGTGVTTQGQTFYHWQAFKLSNNAICYLKNHKSSYFFEKLGSYN